MSKKDVDRSFRISEISANTDGIGHSVYRGKRPAQAALKAFNWYCRKSGEKTCKTEFTLEEITTADQPGKKFNYIGERKQLEVPKEIKRDGKSYLVHYSSSVHKLV